MNNQNVVNAGDIVFINGVRFRVKYDFNLAHGDKHLLLRKENEPSVYEAKIGRE